MNDPQLFQWLVRVYYEDTDAGGVVYHSQYLNFMERARTEWLRHLGFEQTTLRDKLGVIIVIRSLSIEYHSPARFNDLLTVSCQLAGAGRSSVEITQQIVRDGVTLAQAQIKGVFVSADAFKPVSIPNAIKQAMEAR